MVAISWSAGTLALAVVTALLAGVTAGLAGFGFNLLATPIFLLVIPAKMAIALLAVLALLHSAAMWWHLRRRVDVRRLWPLLVGGVGGIPLGTLLLARTDPSLVKLAVGSTSAAAALAMILGFRRPVAETFHSLALVGLASGVLGGMTGLSGPPVVLLLANQATPKSDFRANLSAFFVVLGLVRLVSYRAAGLLSVGLVPPTAVLVVPTALGLWLGGWLSAVVTDEQFQRVVLGTLLVTSCLVALSGLGLI